MKGAVPIIVVVLPFASALVLALIASWRIGGWVNAGSASLQFIATGVLMWQADTAASRVALLTTFVAMTTSWLDRRDTAAALAERLLSRRRARLYHVGCQVMIGGLQAATLASEPMRAWLALVFAVAGAAAITAAPRAESAARAASRLIRHCSAGLALALLGTLLLGLAQDAAAALLLGYGALAGLVPLHAWLPGAAASARPSGATMLALMANVPLLLLTQLPVSPDLLITFGLISLLAAGVGLFAGLDAPRTISLAAVAQLGMIVFAIGIGVRQAAWLHMALLTLARSAALRSQDACTWLALTLLPLFGLYLLAAPTVDFSAWLIAPLAVGALMTTLGLIEWRLKTVPVTG
jgi:hydrogenase-4 component F